MLKGSRFPIGSKAIGWGDLSMIRVVLAAATIVWMVLGGRFSFALGGQDAGEPADSCRHLGLAFAAQGCPQLSSLRSYHDGGYAVSLAIGLNLPPHVLLTLNVYTGSQLVPQEPTKPTNGDLAVGGAAVEMTYLFGASRALRPYLAGGYGLYTYLEKESGGRGYNGGGFHIEPGLQWDFSRYLAVRGGVQYSQIRFHDPVGEASQSPGFEAFTARLVGFALRVSFFPAVLP